MSERPERSVKAAQVPMGSGPGMSPSVGVSAPVGAVSRKDRTRAERTTLRREGPSAVVLHTWLPGTAHLQRRTADGGWETVETRKVSRLRRRTRLDLPGGDGSTVHRVTFSPRNPNLTPWSSDELA